MITDLGGPMEMELITVVRIILILTLVMSHMSTETLMMSESPC